MDHFTCPKCDFVVEMDKLDCAFCPKCGAIFNDDLTKPISETAKMVKLRKYTKFAKRC